MWFFLTSRVVSSLVAFLYPGYASYKTLSQRPASEEDLERWLMYWCVLGFVVGVEYVAEWVISWIPFYHTLKMLFLLYIALPQTQGSSYLYKTHLQPFFRTHETQIDSTLARVKSKLYSFIQQRARMMWAAAAAAIGQPLPEPSTASTGVGRELEEEDRMDSAHPPTLGNPISGPAALVSNLWSSYGPGILAGGMALVSSASAAAANADATRKRATPPGMSMFTTPPGSRVLRSSNNGHSRQGSTEERKRQLEAELAALNTPVLNVDGDEGLAGSSSTTTTSGRRKSSESIVKRRGVGGDHVRARSGSGGSGKFEEVEVPSDVEDESETAASAGGGGWFSGWGGAKGSERVKSD